MTVRNIRNRRNIHTTAYWTDSVDVIKQGLKCYEELDADTEVGGIVLPAGTRLTKIGDGVRTFMELTYEELPLLRIIAAIKAKADTALQGETDPQYNADKDLLALKADLPTKVSDLENDEEYTPRTAVEEAFEEHNADEEAHPSILAILDNLVGLPEWDDESFVLTFTAHDGSTLEVDLPLESLAKDLDYDPDTKEIILTKEDDSEIRVSVADLIDVYNGSNGTHIQVSIGAGNVINATLKAGTITETELATALLAKINGKLDATAQAADSAKLGGKLPSEYASIAQGTKADTADNTLGIYDFEGHGFTTLLQAVLAIFPTLSNGQSVSFIVAPATYATLTDWTPYNTGSSAIVTVTRIGIYSLVTVRYGSTGGSPYQRGTWTITTNIAGDGWETLGWVLNSPDVSYSTTERYTGKTWVDGKPIYRRAFSGNITGTAGALVQTPLINSGISSIVACGGYWSDGTNRFSVNGFYDDSSGANTYKHNSCIYIGATNNLNMVTSDTSATRSGPYQVWVEYTKV